MTPSSLARLSLRIIAASLLLLYFPSQISLMVSTINIGLQSQGRNIIPPEFILMLVAFILVIGAVVFVWFRAEGLAKFLLPASTLTVQVENYNEWERGGLMLIGGCLIVSACLGLPTLIFGNMFVVYGGAYHLTFFNLIVGVVLIFGVRTILGAAKRLMRLPSKP